MLTWISCREPIDNHCGCPNDTLPEPNRHGHIYIASEIERARLGTRRRPTRLKKEKKIFLGYFIHVRF